MYERMIDLLCSTGSIPDMTTTMNLDFEFWFCVALMAILTIWFLVWDYDLNTWELCPQDMPKALK